MQQQDYLSIGATTYAFYNLGCLKLPFVEMKGPEDHTLAPENSSHDGIFVGVGVTVGVTGGVNDGVNDTVGVGVTGGVLEGVGVGVVATLKHN